MSKLQKAFEDYTSLSRPALLKVANRMGATALSHLSRIKEGNENELLSAIVATALGADGTLSDAEIGFMGELFSLSQPKEKLTALTARFQAPHMRETIDRMIDGMEKEGKSAICTLCLCILASDKTISPEENEFLLRLIQ